MRKQNESPVLQSTFKFESTSVCKIPRGSSDLHTDFNIFIIFDKVKNRQIVCPEG